MTDANMAAMTTILTGQHATNIGKIVLALREHVPASRGRFALPGTPWAIPLLNLFYTRDTVKAVILNLIKIVENDYDPDIIIALADLSDEEAADIVASMLPWKEPAVRVAERKEQIRNEESEI